MAKQIIKGALYFDGDTVLRAHYSGNFHTVDCTEYKTRKEIKANYSESIAKEFLSNYPITVDGKKYYECEYSPYHTENLELLSDLSPLEFYDDETEFTQ